MNSALGPSLLERTFECVFVDVCLSEGLSVCACVCVRLSCNVPAFSMLLSVKHSHTYIDTHSCTHKHIRAAAAVGLHDYGRL